MSEIEAEANPTCLCQSLPFTLHDHGFCVLQQLFCSNSPTTVTGVTGVPQGTNSNSWQEWELIGEDTKR